MKYIKYLILMIPYLVAYSVFILIYKNATIITYLLIMILPILISSVSAGILKRKKILLQDKGILAFFCTIIYAAFFVLIELFIKSHEVLKYVYENSQYLFRTGFSIGNNFSINLVDAILPCGICYVLHVFAIFIINKASEAVW